MKARKKRDGQDYGELIKTIRGINRSISELRHYSGIPPGKSFIIRHDVDASIDHAIKLARLEVGLGIKSTYFLLHTADYWKNNRVFRKKIQALINLGHEVGLHNNALTTSLLENRSPRLVLHAALALLRDAGAEVTATSAHGCEPCYRFGYRNYEVFTSFEAGRNEAGGRTIPEEWKVSLKELGLFWEANLSPFDYYLSDSHGKWLGAFRQKAYPFPYERTLSEGYTWQRTILTKFNRGWHPDDGWEKRDRLLQLLLHPIHWEIR